MNRKTILEYVKGIGHQVDVALVVDGVAGKIAPAAVSIGANV
jgi:hypothetical protein